MKRILLLFLLFTSLILVIENSVTSIKNYKPDVTVTLDDAGYKISWPRLSYLCYYEVEVLTQPPSEDLSVATKPQKIVSHRTWHNEFSLDENSPSRTYWRVSAQGIFTHPLGQYSDFIDLPTITDASAAEAPTNKPALLTNYSPATPAAMLTILEWNKYPGAVYYELEFSATAPTDHDAPSPSKIFSTKEVFSNGYIANLGQPANKYIYWRVRAYDFQDRPISTYSDPGTIYIDANKPYTKKPIINGFFNVDDMPTPLYPVYSWFPINGVNTYEVEITSSPPENRNDAEPSMYRIWSKTITGGSDLYDEIPRNIPGTYYWRVRGLDTEGNSVGIWSEAAPFIVDLSRGKEMATFGDSITHGGGAISYSPADTEYCYQTYLKFTAVNLGKSGDTSESMVERFDRDVLPFHPKVLLIMGGANSLREGIPAIDVIRDFTLIKNKCLAHDIKPIFMTLPPINPANIMRAFNEDTVPNWRQEFALVNAFIRQQPQYIDLAPYFTNFEQELPTYYAADGLHYDIEGKKLMAQIINAKWDKLLK